MVKDFIMGTPQELINLLEYEANAFELYLTTLSENDWMHPSACDGWTVAHVVAHVAGQDFSLRIRRGLSGDTSPPPGSPDPEDHDEDKFAQVIFERAFSTVDTLGKNLLNEFSARLEDSIEVFKSVCSTKWDTLCYWPPGPERIETMLEMRISELTMHAWDVRSELESDYHISPSSVQVLCDTVPRAIRRAFRPDPEIKSPIRYRFNLVDFAGNIQDVVVTAEGAYLEEGLTESSSPCFNCSAESYVLIMYGRLKIEDALSLSLLECEQGHEIAIEFGNRFIGG